MSASLSRHTAFSARPRPFSSRCTTRRPSTLSVSETARRTVPSVLALSATVIRAGYGTLARRWASRRRTASTMSSCSLYTGMTMSSVGWGCEVSARVCTVEAGRPRVSVVMSYRLRAETGTPPASTCQVPVNVNPEVPDSPICSR